MDTLLSDTDEIKSDEDKLSQLLENYQELLAAQAEERKRLLEKVNELAVKSEKVGLLDNKIESLTKLLLDIKEQINAISDKNSKTISPVKSSKVVASDEDIDHLSSEIEAKGKEMDERIEILEQLLEQKLAEGKEKDMHIEQLNERVKQLSREKNELAKKLEELSAVTSTWSGQLDLLQKLAKSDPRYKAIETLKRHGTLSDIQLAFSMGASIIQVKKYVEDLINLGLVKKDKVGRYMWIGKI